MQPRPVPGPPVPAVPAVTAVTTAGAADAVPAVTAALASLDGLAGRPLDEHVGVFDAVHRGLQDALAALDER